MLGASAELAFLADTIEAKRDAMNLALAKAGLQANAPAAVRGRLLRG
jgi:hypothetical protein